jgi:apolipoprotein N-acyltransferase
MKLIKLYLLSILSGLLLSYGWFPNEFAPLLFVGFVPLLLVEQILFKRESRYRALTLFSCSYLTFFVWNCITSYWIKNASMEGALMALITNSLLMTIVFVMFHKAKQRIGEKWGSTIFVLFWMAFEYIHLRWDISWSWLTLGNGLYNNSSWIQWYEYTGVFGGSLWILLINNLIFSILKNRETDAGIRNKKIITALTLFILPIGVSLLIKYSYQHSTEVTDKSKTQRVVVVQPNIDPYDEKFSGNYIDQLDKMLRLATQKTDSTTDYVLFPETALQEDIWENAMEQSQSIIMIKQFLKKFPKLKMVVGASTRKFYKDGEKPSLTARRYIDFIHFYDEFNTALQLDSSRTIQKYHKSKLVPGVEAIPFPAIFKYVEALSLEMGGTSGSLGMQDERTVFTSSNKMASTAPVICYESIFGEYVSEYVKNGAQFISVITNDGWWGDTPGYKQHLRFSVLRAIETRRWVARAANTGVSAFVNPVGEMVQTTDYWVPAVLAQDIQLNSTLTFYTRYGDYIGFLAMWISLFILIYSWMIRFRIIKR